MINIAIDGFTGSGKSTLAKVLAQRLGYKILDTGAIFRALGYGYSKAELGGISESSVKKFVKTAKIEVVFKDDGQHTLLNGEDVTTFLRTEEISQLASKISAYPEARKGYLKIAQKFAKTFDCVMEGRDIATIVMPNADVKIFITADAKIRAKRRYLDLKKKDKSIKLADVLADLQERDLRDSTREVAPLMPTEESVIVDNTDMTFDETVEYCLDVIKEKLKENEKKINIAIDGYVCSGKSTIAKALAKKLGFKVFDTGAVYRGIACAFDYMGLDEKKIDERYIDAFSKQISVKIEFIEGVQHVFVNGIDHTRSLRLERTSALTAKISPFPNIREKTLKIQRDFAKENDLVMEGRDIGSFVLPNADFKFFCTADEQVRAKRRFEQQKAMGNDVEYDKILEELRKRDYADTHRDHGAITIMPDSIIVDTTSQVLEQSVAFCVKEIRKKFPKL
ncbi:MAG: (d)CMP kinase [Clostridia bacterium]|nr:(d)CMP kinase [Clostridia bacterium]